MATTQRDVAGEIRKLAEERILVLDGAWGVLLQNRGLNEADFRGERFKNHRRDLLNDPDLLNLTRPDIVREVHDAYFAAGADITTTNTFTATSIGQSDYQLQSLVRDMNLRGAQLARQAADEFGGRFVPETLVPALEELEAEFRAAWADDQFRAEFAHDAAGFVEAGFVEAVELDHPSPG